MIRLSLAGGTIRIGTGCRVGWRFAGCRHSDGIMKRAPFSWTNAADAMSFALACQQVIALRMARIARGDAGAQREMTRMVAEKAAAAVEANIAAVRGLMTGGLSAAADASAQVYQRAVRANGRRLRRP
jgi:hypothetical protein